MSLIECYWILQNFSVTAFTVLELLRKNQLEGEGGGGGGKTTPPPSLPRLGLKDLIKTPILSALEKMCHIPHVIFETTSQLKVMLDKSVNNVLGEGM